MDGLVLVHHGIKGQKWGYRRWQNPDGSLTLEGYKHYGRGIPKALKNHRAKKIAKTDKTLAKLDKKQDKNAAKVKGASIDEVRKARTYIDALHKRDAIEDKLYRKENGLTAKLIGSNGWTVRKLKKKLDSQERLVNQTKDWYDEAKQFTAEMEMQYKELDIAIANTKSYRKQQAAKFIDQYSESEYKRAAKRYNFNE